MNPVLYPIVPQSGQPKCSVEEVGNKAWNLMRMAAAGLPVPAGFVLPTSKCKQPVSGSDALESTLSTGIVSLEAATGLRFGSRRNPLLVSIRSGAAVSMPGMLETVLDIGLNPDSVEGLIRLTGNPRLAWDCYRRLIQGYAEVVQELPPASFDELVAQAISAAGVESDRELDFRRLRQLAGDMAARFHELAGEPFPADPWEQLKRAVLAVFRSWGAAKAAAYRRMNRIDDSLGTAVTVQQMVFGNAGGKSGSGVGFTRNPASGERELYLDFCFNGQGEDVVAGRQRTEDHERLARALPETWRQLQSTSMSLEALFRDAQDFEFTLENGWLYLLQSRDAKRSDLAALRIAVDLVEEGLIEPDEAQQRLSRINLSRVLRTRLEAHSSEVLARAQAASLGVTSGALVLDSATAERMAKNGPVILVRRAMDTSDIDGIACAAGILSASGSRTSHAAVVARQLGKVCLVGCGALEVDLIRRCCTIGERTLNEGDVLSLDGNEGCIYAGKVEIIEERPYRELQAIAEWQRNSIAAAHAGLG